MISSAQKTHRLPSLADFKSMMTMLFGSSTDCTERTKPLPVQDYAIIASYRDNLGKIQRLIVCDVAFANSSGAALSAIPFQVANGATKSGKVAENILENLSEVMNVSVNLFIECFGSRLELAAVEPFKGCNPDTMAALASQDRVKINVTFRGYESGRLDLIAVENADTN